MVRYKDTHLVGLKGTFPRKLKTKKSKPKVTEPEAVVQEQVETYLNIHGVPFVRLPDALMRGIFASHHIPPHQKKVISSYLKGLPDILAFHPSKKVDDYRVVLPLELKTERGNLTQGQKAWQRKIGTLVANGYAAAKEQIDKFLALE